MLGLEFDNGGLRGQSFIVGDNTGSSRNGWFCGLYWESGTDVPDPVSSCPGSYHDRLLTSFVGAASWSSSAGGAFASSTGGITLVSGGATLSVTGAGATTGSSSLGELATSS